MGEIQKCEGRVPKTSGWGSTRCPNTAKVARGGAWYCGVHDPNSESKLRRKQESDARVHAEAQQMERRRYGGGLLRDLAPADPAAGAAALRALVEAAKQWQEQTDGERIGYLYEQALLAALAQLEAAHG